MGRIGRDRPKPGVERPTLHLDEPGVTSDIVLAFQFLPPDLCTSPLRASCLRRGLTTGFALRRFSTSFRVRREVLLVLITPSRTTRHAVEALGRHDGRRHVGTHIVVL